MTTEQNQQLVRAIGRWSLAALVINSVIGSGIFGLPSIIAGLLGSLSLLAYLLAALGNGVIMGVFAELASRFTAAGGAYLYAREALGRFAGIQIGWMSWLVRITAAAANANLFVIYLAEFWPRVREPRLRALVVALLLGLLAGVNYRGVRSGANVSNFFTVAKLVPLAIFLAVGTIFVLARDPSVPPLSSSATSDEWVRALLLLAFAYGGYDGALMPLGEAKNPRRDAPFALFTAMIALLVIYAGIQWLVMAILPNPDASDRPLADAARIFLGPPGAVLMAVGALVSVYGYLSANVLNAPRLTFALASRRDFPPAFAWLHPRYHTPYISILAFVFVTWLLAVWADFPWNAEFSGVTRLFTYGSACLAFIALRRYPDAAPPAFRLPAGNLLAALGLVFCLVLMSQMGWIHLLIVGITILIALVNWLWARRTATATGVS